MIGSIFIDEEGNEVEIVKWTENYVGYTYWSLLTHWTPKKKFLKEFEQKEEENEQL